MTELEGAARLAIAALVGLGVGVEREWSAHVRARAARFAGMRTFFMLGVLGGSAGLLGSGGHATAAALLIAGGMAMSVAAFVLVSRAAEEPDGTTEVAALLVVALGALAGIGMLTLAAGTGAIVVLALSEKQRLHGAVHVVREAELQGALRFGVLALVVLPLLPRELAVGRLVLQPRSLWMIVLLFCALNYAAFIVRRLTGARHGYGVVGMLGGLISSTAVTLDFSRRSRNEPELARSLATGVVGACTVLIPRVLVVSAVLNPDVALQLLRYLAPAALVGGAIIARDWRGDGEDTAPSPSAANPLRLWMAIRMAVLFQAAMLAVDYVRSVWTTPGLYATAAALGLTDVDALTVAMSRPTEPIAAEMAARAITVGILMNTVFKLSLALGLGARRFRGAVATGLTALGGVTALSLWAL